MPQPIPSDAEFWRGYYAPRLRRSAPRLSNLRVLDGTREELEAKHEAEFVWFREARDRVENSLHKTIDAERAEAAYQRGRVYRAGVFSFFAGGFVVGATAFLIHLSTITG